MTEAHVERAGADAPLTMRDYLRVVNERHLEHSRQHGCWHRSPMKLKDADGVVVPMAWKVFLPGTAFIGTAPPDFNNARYQSVTPSEHGGSIFAIEVTPPCDDEGAIQYLARKTIARGKPVEIPADFRKATKRMVTRKRVRRAAPASGAQPHEKERIEVRPEDRAAASPLKGE